MEQIQMHREGSVTQAIPPWRGPGDVANRGHMKGSSHQELRRFLRIEALLSRSSTFQRRLRA
jgi:hypothetical protein